MFLTPVSASGKINSLIYVGEINKRKNLKIVLEALGILKKEGIIFKLNVAGGYREESYKQVITELVDEKGIQDQLVFHGWMTQQQIFSLLEESSIFVLPSLQETLPLSIGEAMARGKVVVASNVGGIAEMFTDKTSGFIFERDNLEQLVVLLRNLYNNQNLIDSVSKQARIDADGKFAADLVAAQTINFYRQVISKAIGNKLK